ncbi:MULTISPECIES: DUF645 family protein [Vibrio]
MAATSQLLALVVCLFDAFA